ncbi:MAG: inositol monophosphatase [Agathobacter sp.]|nr:inositol monophosphatase [Agathobacter sp.]MBQ2283096.1 inositol monophosphatase [Agathobacter sp.]
MNYGVIIVQIQQAVKEASRIMLSAKRVEESVSSKEGHANFVTTYDKKVQEQLKARLLEILPEAHFCGEEGEDAATDINKGYVYIVDPIDGTTNFIKDFKVSAISVGLAHNGHMKAGVVYNPYLDEMFSAVAGQGAYLNGNPIHVSKAPLSEALVIFGTSPYNQELAERSFRLAYEYFTQAMDVRRTGSAALDLCSIASGRAELYFELILQPWDYAAGSLIVEEAGGRVTTVDEEPIRFDQPCSIMAVGKGVKNLSK